ncbi:RluA family pseudouridine synthase [Chungangia koreensis]|uniref:Pseudouridine synthase n=1 Tax=Chungangia koreensis TaxID=752657 RepID=A0ABV8X279_9LACT
MTKKRFQLTFTAEQDGLLLRDALKNWGISKRTLTAVKFSGGELIVNGVERTVRHLLSEGDLVTIVFPPEEVSEGISIDEGELDIVFEDETLLVINKPFDQATIPSFEHPTGTVANFAAYHLKRKGIPSTVHVVTRLDRDTSGLLCMTKNRHVHHLMDVLQKERKLQKFYVAIVHGHMKEDFLSVIAPIGRKEGSIIERKVSEEGQYAHTDVEVLKRIERGGQPFSVIRLKLHTGRTHQIRVHMSHIGHPLTGDDLYGGEKGLIQRHALHCHELLFPHPITGNMLQLTAPLPDDMSRFIHQNE